MKPKLKHLYAFVAILMLCGCEDINGIKEVRSSEGFYDIGTLIVDTISIRGYEHEVIFRSYGNEGGLMHSPECWCKKEDEK